MKGPVGQVIVPIKVQNWADVEIHAAGRRKTKPRQVET
jgi:predicted aspartyl protease